MTFPKTPIVLAAVDLFKGSSLVLSRALQLAAGDSEDRGTVHVVHVTEPNIGNVKPTEVDAPDLTGYDPSAVQKLCDKHLKDFAVHHAGPTAPKIVVHTVTGDPADQIVAEAARVDADVIVLATHGRTGLKRLLLGSVAEKVVRLAGCPVFVLREKHHHPPA
ncbi:MAG: universal stress protein [Polyangiaceae bacterium]